MLWLLRIMGRPNSAHFDGTLVPGRSRPQHQNLTHAVQQNRPLFDNVVGAAEQREPNPSALAVVAGCTCRSLGFSLLRFSRHKCRAADTPRQDWFRNSETARHDA